MRRSALTLALLILLAPGTMVSQELSRRQFDEFTDLDMLKSAHEKSYLFPGGGFGLQDRVLFEANIAPHLVYPWEISGAGHFAVDITPKFVVRMFQEDSNPVRTPSYMPRGTLYYWWRSHDDWQNTDDNFTALFLTLSHHSNGQPPSSFFNPDGSINHIDGDFSTNFVELGLYTSRMPKEPGDTQEELALKRRLSKLEQFGESISLEWHPGIDQTDELRGRYGMWRLNLRSNLSAVFGKAFFGSHIHPVDDIIRSRDVRELVRPSDCLLGLDLYA
jgi:hypothetical protein